MIPKTEHIPQRQHPSSSQRATLEGWAAVENEMLKHDEGTTTGYLSDVDTLLVFAGLFSAVLTAFVVESYQQLQLDTGMGSMMVLRRISVQLETFTLSPGFANSSSAAPPLPSLDFVADPATRWINALWFLSLIFSLAAALFGILVKQWIREYMQWNAALAPPRDNVLVRQIRFEAWNSWNVPATIASIPALLEVALVFFVCGLVILLWTLDPVVSIVITTAVAVFLAIASTFTILPAFFQRCPYKSPTAWACAVLWDFVTRWIPHAVNRLQHSLGERLRRGNNGTDNSAERVGQWLKRSSGLENWRLDTWTAISSDWRTRDLVNIWSSFAPRTRLRTGDAKPLLDALLWEQSCADSDHPCREVRATIDAWLNQTVSKDAVRLPLHNALRTITELPPLARALAWISQASQDEHILRCAARCVESLDSRFVLPQPMIATTQNGWVLTQEGVRAVSIWHLLVSFGRNDELTTDGYRAAIKDMGAFRAINVKGSQYPRPCNPHNEGGRARLPYQVGFFYSLFSSGTSQEAVAMLVMLSALSIRHNVAELPDDSAYSALRKARRTMELLAVLRSLWDVDKNNHFISEAANCLLDTVRPTNDHTRQILERKFPGLRPSICAVARALGARWTNETEAEIFGPFPIDSTVSTGGGLE